MAEPSRAWELVSDPGPVRRRPDEDFDCRLRVQLHPRVVSPVRRQPATLPAVVPFETTRLALVEDTDLPANATGWPVLSERLLAALRAVGPFEHQTWRAEIVDPRGRRNVRPFVVVQVLDIVDALDLERSEYQPLPGSPHIPLFLRRAVLRPEVPLPPLFRLSTFGGPLLVNDAAREALLALPAERVRFQPL